MKTVTFLSHPSPIFYKNIQKFIKVSSYLKTKKENIQSIFDSIKDIPDEELLNEYVEILKGNIFKNLEGKYCLD